MMKAGEQPAFFFGECCWWNHLFIDDAVRQQTGRKPQRQLHRAWESTRSTLDR
jgi:hypothetical protein